MSDHKHIEVLRQIAEDMAADAHHFEGQPFDGPTVAHYLGNLGAGIAAIARILAEELEARPGMGL